MKPQGKVLGVVLAVALILALVLTTLVLVPSAWAHGGHDVAFCLAPFGVFDDLVLMDHAVADFLVTQGFGWYPFPDGTCVAAPPPPPPPAAPVAPPAVVIVTEEPPGRPNRANMYITGCFMRGVTIVLIQPEKGNEVGRFTTAQEACDVGYGVVSAPLLLGNQDAAWVMAFALLPDGTPVRLRLASEVPCQIHETSDMCGVLLTTPGSTSHLGILP